MIRQDGKQSWRKGDGDGGETSVVGRCYDWDGHSAVLEQPERGQSPRVRWVDYRIRVARAAYQAIGEKAKRLSPWNVEAKTEQTRAAGRV